MSSLTRSVQPDLAPDIGIFKRASLLLSWLPCPLDNRSSSTFAILIFFYFSTNISIKCVVLCLLSIPDKPPLVVSRIFKYKIPKIPGRNIFFEPVWCFFMQVSMSHSGISLGKSYKIILGSVLCGALIFRLVSFSFAISVNAFRPSGYVVSTTRPLPQIFIWGDEVVISFYKHQSIPNYVACWS